MYALVSEQLTERLGSELVLLFVCTQQEVTWGDRARTMAGEPLNKILEKVEADE